MNSKIYTLTIIFLLVGCDLKQVKPVIDGIAVETSWTDIYPEIGKGIQSVKGTLLTEIFIEDATNGHPALFWISNKCKLLTTASRYGNVSVEFKPVSIVCIIPSGETIEKKLNPTDISSAYVNGTSSKEKDIVFHLYSSEIDSMISTGES